MPDNKKKQLRDKIRYILPVVIIVLLVCMSGCKQPTGNPVVSSKTTTSPTSENTLPAGTIAGHSITAQEAKNLLDAGQAVLILDVRTQPEFDGNHINGAVSIPVADLPNRLSEIPSDKQIVVYAQCH